MKNNVLITGGSGFVGSHLTKRLLALNFNVHIIIIPNSNLDLLEDCIDNITLHEYHRDYSSIDNAFKASKPDIVFHLASVFISEHTEADIEYLIYSNILFGTYLLEAMVKNNVTYLINTGTSWQHYENKDYSPVNLYAATKQAFEDIIKYYTEAGKIKVIHLKLFDTYGQDDYRPKLMKLLKNCAENSQKIEISAGNQLLDLVYIDDVINAFIRACELLFEGNIVNKSFGISSGNLVSLKNLISIINGIIGKDLHVVFDARPYRNREVMVPWNSFEILPDWEPKISLQTGIKLFFKI